MSWVITYSFREQKQFNNSIIFDEKNMIHIVKSTAQTQWQQNFKLQVITKGFLKEE